LGGSTQKTIRQLCQAVDVDLTGEAETKQQCEHCQISLLSEATVTRLHCKKAFVILTIANVTRIATVG